MGLAAAALRWRAEEFWASTNHEFRAALEGLKEINTPRGD